MGKNSSWYLLSVTESVNYRTSFCILIDDTYTVIFRIEFTDFLGRTRKCLKSDLEYYKKRDEELKKVLMTNSNNQEPVHIVSIVT